MVAIIDAAFAILEQILGQFKSKMPAELAQAAQAAVDAWAAHKADAITWANLEEQR